MNRINSYQLLNQIEQFYSRLILLISLLFYYGHIVGIILIQLLQSSTTYNGLAVNAEHRAGSYRRTQISTMYQAPCNGPNECRFENTQCNIVAKRCQCKNDFVQVDSFVNRSYITHLAMTCLPIARIDERCVSDLQCIVDYSECKLTTEIFGRSNRTVHLCKCSQGHELKDDQSTVILDGGHSYRVRPICDPERSTSSSWILTIIFISILVLVILVGTFVLIVRYQRLRQPYNQSTITSLTSQGINSHTMGQHPLGSSSPPPMGSAEAEFQNDFIQVFPMHHLEPMPDKNAHAFIIK